MLFAANFDKLIKKVTKMKMYGMMTADELFKFVSQCKKEVSENPSCGDHNVLIPRTTLIDVVDDLKDCLNRHIFYELGKICLSQDLESVLSQIPNQYQNDFNQGVIEANELRKLHERCLTCEYKITPVETPRGRIFIGKQMSKVESKKEKS